MKYLHGKNRTVALLIIIIAVMATGCSLISPPERRHREGPDPKPWGGPQQEKDHRKVF